MRSRWGPGLRARLTLLATGLSAAVSALLLWLGWLLVGGVVAAVPDLPPSATVTVNGVPVAAHQLGEVLREAARQRVLQAGSVAFLLAVTATVRRLSAESLDKRLGVPGPRDEVAESRRMATVIRDATLRAQQLVDGLLVLARTRRWRPSGLGVD